MRKNISKEEAVFASISITYVALFALHLFVSARVLGSIPISDDGPGKEFLGPKTILAYDHADTKFLQYFVQAGWSNQVICLKHAYEVALATGRGLVLSPVVPHFQLYMNDVMDVNTREFKLDYNLKDAYLRKLSSTNYVPLGNILDLEVSLPGLVSKVDFEEFYRHRADANIDPWAMEANATHFDTHWVRNEPAIEGSQEEIDMTEHQLHLHYSPTFRDIEHFSDTTPFRKNPVWTLLDSYRVTLHESVYFDGKKSSFRPRFQTKILAASQAIQKGRWKNIPYAAVHIRGSDGYFKKKKRDVIQRVLNLALWQIDDWARNHQIDSTADTQTIGLFVATDIRNLRHDAFFQKRISFSKKNLKDIHGINLKILFSDESPAKEAQVNALFDRTSPGWVGYPGIFLDQQLAACATIGFVGTEGSTFSSFIRELRADNLTETCGQESFSS